MEQSSQEKLKQQYDSLPYPKVPMEESPKENLLALFNHNLTTSYYLYRQKVINTKDKVILDVGCGSGWTTLQLAFANPDAKIIAIDLSQNSLDFAEKRLKHHGFNNVEYYQVAMENIHQLNYEYDYINGEDVLYFCDNPAESLKALKSVLKPDGVIHGNFHSYYQRFYHYLSQNLFKRLGLFDENPEDFEISVVAQTMQNLKPQVVLKQYVGTLFNQKNIDLTSDNVKQHILMNSLIQNDRGYTIPQVFQVLRESQLQFLSMVNWLQWDIKDLFQDRNKIPTVWEFTLDNTTEEEQLELFELLQPSHRLIDFWCVHENNPQEFLLLSSWKEEDWQKARIHLHPQLKSDTTKQDLRESIEKQISWDIGKFIPMYDLFKQIYIDIPTHLSALLLPLWEKSLTFNELVSYWLKIQPINLTTLEVKTTAQAQKEVQELVMRLEGFLYLLVEKQS